jgi:YfiH family protein
VTVPQFLRAAALADATPLRHGFFTRAGGVSAGRYDSLNCGFGSQDDPAAVATNRARVEQAVGAAAGALVTVHQVHGTTVAMVEAPWAAGTGPKADAMVTNRPGIVLGILTADCAPILFADPAAGVIGAAHAGWKGAKAGVTDTVVAAMIRHGANVQNIVAAVGPVIGPASYEVGPEFRQAFLDDDPQAAVFFSDGPRGRPHFDLPGFVVHRLEMLNLGGIDRIEADTCADAERFFSYRRSCLTGEPDYGRQLSAIALA